MPLVRSLTTALLLAIASLTGGAAGGASSASGAGTGTWSAGAPAAEASLPPEGWGAGPAEITHLLAFVLEGGGSAADLGFMAGVGPTSLAAFDDVEVALVAPRLEPSARLALSAAEWNLLLGDDDVDGDFWEDPGGEIDALGRRPDAPDDGSFQTEHWIFSTEQPFGLADPEALDDGLGALDGSLFWFGRDAAGAPEVRLFLREELILSCLGQGDDPAVDDVDVDAFTVDAAGNVFLSFRSTEWVNGTLLADDGVVCLPGAHLYESSPGVIGFVEPGCARIVWDKPQVDDLVQHAAVVDEQGKPIKILEDLTGLALDPAGGHFPPLQPIDGLPDGAPHLLFTGTRLGPTLLSTRHGGSLARLNGRAAGASPLHPAPLGLAPSAASTASLDLSAIHVDQVRQRAPMIDVEQGELHFLYTPQGVLLLDGFAPHGLAWVLLDAIYPHYGEQWPALPHAGAGASLRLVLQPQVGLAVPLDGQGRARHVLPPGGEPGFSFCVLVQALEVGSGRLSRPATFWFWNGGVLAGTPLED